MGTMPEPFRKLAREIRENNDRWLGGNQQALDIIGNEHLLRVDFWNRFIQARAKKLNKDLSTYLKMEDIDCIADSLVFTLMLVEKQPASETAQWINAPSWKRGPLNNKWPNSQKGRIQRYQAYSEVASELARIIKEDNLLNMMTLKKDGFDEYWFEVVEALAEHLKNPGFGTAIPVGSDISIPKGENAKRYRAEQELIDFLSFEVGPRYFDLVADAMYALLKINETPEAIEDRYKKRQRRRS